MVLPESQTPTQAEVVERVRKMAEGCCGDDSWRGRFCQYHAGYRDGFDDAIETPADSLQEGT